MIPCEHAEERLDEKGLDILDVRHVLFHGRIVERQEEEQCVRFVYRGTSLDGDGMKCVVEIDESDVVTIVTSFRIGAQVSRRKKK